MIQIGFEFQVSQQGREAETRQAHNLEIAGSTPAPATTPQLVIVDRISAEFARANMGEV